MFNKLLSVLPYNPGLLPQMAFYGQRMRQETSIRRIGMFFIVLAFLVQFFAVLSPPQSTVAGSSNDLINGGISSRGEAVSSCNANTHYFGDVLGYYGIKCSDLAGAETVNITSTGQDRQLYSMGRLAYGKAGETPVYVKGASYFWRYLWSWDTGGPSTYKALKFQSSTTGKTYWLLYNCGNLTTIGVPSPPLTPINPFPTISVPTPKPTTPTPTPAATPAATPTPTPTPTTPTTPSTPSTPTPTPCQYNASLPAGSPDCKPCDESVSSADTTACITVSKTATNNTQNILDANNTTAQAGDTITYTLHAKNAGKATVKDYVFQENISDVLDYADVVDLYGGTLSSDKVVKWPAQDIAAKSEGTVKLRVKVKDPIPQTPAGLSDPGHFDLVMTNVYGNTINIKLPGSPTKTVETAAASLPNTGPGTSLLIGGIIVMFAGYFVARSRLLATEAELAVKNNAGGEA